MCEKRLALPTALSVLALACVCSFTPPIAAAQQSGGSVDSLASVVANLVLAIDAQSERLAQVEAQVAHLVAALDSARQNSDVARPQENRASPVTPLRGWRNSSAWGRVKDGMSERQVTSILGQPTSVERVSPWATLFYRGEVSGSGFVSGNLLLRNDRVVVVEEPVF